MKVRWEPESLPRIFLSTSGTSARGSLFSFYFWRLMDMTPAQKKALVLANAASSGGGRFPERLAVEHCRRLDADYFNEFSVAEIEGHLGRIAALTPAEPYSFEFSPLADRTFGLT